MKKLWLSPIVILIITFSARAQKMKAGLVPASVKTSFVKAHPHAAAKWEKEGNNYEVNFKEGNKEASCVLDKEGKILETETGIAVTELPVPVRNYVRQHYSHGTIKEAARIVKEDGTVNYEAALNGKALMFDAAGKFIKTEKD